MTTELKQILLRGDTSAGWLAANPVLADREVAIDTDVHRVKVGDGVTAWSGLPWAMPDTGTVAQLEEIADAVSGAVTPNDAVTAALVAQSGSATKAAVESTVDARVGPSAADQMANPESALQSATIELIDDRLGGGVSGMIRVVDARGALSTARPSWAGQVVWYVNAGDANPSNFIAGDAVWEVDTVAVPWTPALMPNKVVWLDAQALTLSAGSAVATWTDLSGLGNHYEQATSTARPVLTAAKINGHPAVVSDGVDDFLARTYGADVPAPFTIYAVAGTDLADNTAGADYLWDHANAAGTQAQGSLYRGTTEAYSQQQGSTISSADAAWTVGAKIIKATYNGASSSTVVNGVTVASGTLTTGLTMRSHRLFTRHAPASNNFFAGYIGEYVMVQGVPSSADDTKMLNYLATHWGL